MIAEAASPLGLASWKFSVLGSQLRHDVGRVRGSLANRIVNHTKKRQFTAGILAQLPDHHAG